MTEVFPGVKDFGLFEVFQRVWITGEAERHPVALYEDERISGWRDNFVYSLPSKEIVTIYSDETKRRQAEEALRDSQKRLNSIIRGVPDIIYRLDSNGNISFISDAVKKYAYSPEELLNTNILRLVHPDDRIRAKHRIRERRTKRRATQLFEVRLFAKRPVGALSEGKSEDTEGELMFLITA